MGRYQCLAVFGRDSFILLIRIRLLKRDLHMKVVDCRVCGDPNSVLRFAFVEFTDEGKVNYLPRFYMMHDS